MNPQIVRAIARNLVIAGTLGLAVVASWAVTGLRNPAVDLGTATVCTLERSASALLRQCDAGGPRS